ncbi:hypothetical protein EON76_02045 [bacterium]|nr:MAG: hypothetical protein EON76_02045 [bacterium]
MLFAVVTLVASILSSYTVSAQGSAVNAIICSSGSTVTLQQPTSDSIVTSPVVTISGQVTQASQVEVYVNDQLDSISSIPVGQSAFSTTATVSTGTSTIKVVAVDICQLQSGQASSVVTFNPPPENSGSNGSDAQTNLPGQGVIIGGDYKVQPKTDDQLPFLDLVPPVVGRAFTAVSDWLNITTVFEPGSAPRLTIFRAMAIAIGSWLLAFGLATTVLQWIASSKIFNRIPKSRRIKTIGKGIRGMGLIILVAGIVL